MKIAIFILFLVPSMMTLANTTIDSLELELANSKTDLDKVIILNHLSDLLASVDASAAATYAKEVIALTQKLELIEAEAYGHYYLSSANYVLGLVESANTHLDSAIVKAQEYENNSLLGHALYMKGLLTADKGEMEEARSLYQRSLDLALQSDNNRAQAQALSGLAYVLRRDGNLDSAFTLYSNGLLAAHKGMDTRDIAQAFNNMGVINELRGQVDIALEFYLKALRLAEETENIKSIGVAASNIGSLYFIQNNYDLAQKYGEQGMENYKKLGYRRGLGFSLQDLANIHKNKMELDQALDYYNQAIELRTELGDKRGLSFTYFSLGYLYKRKNDLKNALYYHEKSLQLRKELDYKAGIAGSIMTLGNLSMSAGQYKKGLGYLKEGLDIALEVNEAESVYEAYGVLANGYETMGDYKNAYLNTQKFIQYKDSVFSFDQNEQFARMEVEYQTEIKENEILELKIEKTKISAQRNYILGVGVGLGILGILGFRFNALRRDRNDKKEFAAALLYAQEEERKRIARDLHDGVGQSLLLIKKQLESTTTDALSNQELIASTLHEVRSISQDLHPFQLEKFGLTITLKNIVEKVEQSTDIFISHDIEDIDGLLPKNSEINLYRTIQETINNIIKHSKATAAKMSVHKLENIIEIVIQDNGKGFDGGEKAESRSMGLRTMKERVSSLGGKIEIESILSKGTTISITVPYQS